VAHAISETQDPQLESALVVSQGKLNQAQLEDYQSDALDLYKAKEPKGNIISIRPNDDTSALIITADSVQKDTVKAFKKKFKNNMMMLKFTSKMKRKNSKMSMILQSLRWEQVNPEILMNSAK